jgi:poly(3-hydroxybutyrate) depolymerase
VSGASVPSGQQPFVPPKAASVPPASGDVALPALSGVGGEPIMPAVQGECPKFTNGTISFMGLGGISISAGPKAAGPTAPFVFYWHGTGSFSGEYAGMAAEVVSGLTAEGGVLVSFQGTTGGDALSGTSTFGKGDLDIGDQLVACAVRDHNVDPKRIYATGCSAGGLFATNQAVLRSNYIAAAAPNSGGMTFPQTFQGMTTPALMTVHGMAGQDVVIIDFSQSSATADKLFSARGGIVVNCDHGGGHCGGGSLSGDVWRFFKAHTYGMASASPWKDALPADFNSKCAIYQGQR